jgi:hypothetical protein
MYTGINRLIRALWKSWRKKPPPKARQGFEVAKKPGKTRRN